MGVFMFPLSNSDLPTASLPVLIASPESISGYGIFIGTDVPHSGLTIPFYNGSVEEGYNLPFFCHEKAVIRTARIHKRSGKVQWIERHTRMTQLFIGLGNSSFAMVLGKPNHEQGDNIPCIEDMKVFIFQSGHGIMLLTGTWHDFPLAINESVTVLTVNSEEVVQALASQAVPADMNCGDVFKIDVEKHLKKSVFVDFKNYVTEI